MSERAALPAPDPAERPCHIWWQIRYVTYFRRVRREGAEWNTTTWKEVGATPPLAASINSMAVNPKNGELAVALATGGSQVHPSGGLLDLLQGGIDDHVLRQVSLPGVPEFVAFSPSGSQLAIADYGGGLRVLDSRTAQLRTRVASSTRPPTPPWRGSRTEEASSLGATGRWLGSK